MGFFSLNIHENRMLSVMGLAVAALYTIKFTIGLP